MLTIRLIDARRGLHQQCDSLFRDKRVADAVYSYLCDGLEECDVVEERKKGKWVNKKTNILYPEWDRYTCSVCGKNSYNYYDFCPNCGAYMKEGDVDG